MMSGASSSRCSAARRRVAAGGAGAAGRADAAHWRAMASARMIRYHRPALRRSYKAVSNWAGPTAATCGSTLAGPRTNADDLRRHAAELVALAPDVIVASGTATVAPLLQATRTIPIVFVTVLDPVGAGFVESLARPGGNVTGFLMFEYGLSGKWLELLKEIAPGMTRAAVIRDPAIASGIGQFAAIQAVAPSLGVECDPVDVRDAGEIERAVAAFARSEWRPDRDGGPAALRHRDLIITLAARHRLPAVYPYRYFVAAGGLISYGPDLLDQYRRAAGYVDRILKGDKPADLPVQAPTKYETVINLKTAKALGLDVPAIAARPRRRGDRMRTPRLHRGTCRRGAHARLRRARSSRRCR